MRQVGKVAALNKSILECAGNGRLIPEGFAFTVSNLVAFIFQKFCLGTFDSSLNFTSHSSSLVRFESLDLNENTLLASLA